MSSPLVPVEISSSKTKIGFGARHPVFARQLQSTWHVTRGQLITSLLLSVVGIPLAVRLGLLAPGLSLKTFWFFLFLYGCAFVLIALFNFFREPYRAYKELQSSQSLACDTLSSQLKAAQEALRIEQDKNLRAQLVGEIEDYSISGFVPDIGRGQLQVIIKMSFLNIRQVPAPIRNFRLTLEIHGVEHIAPGAEEYDLQFEAERSHEYSRVLNLASRINEVAHQGTPFDGYLEFVLVGVPIEIIKMGDWGSGRLIVTISDGIGGDHYIEYHRGYLRPSQWGIAGRISRIDRTVP